MAHTAKKYVNDNGVLLDQSTDPPTCCGYLFDFTGHGIYSPDGLVQVTKDEADTHNRLLAEALWTAMLEHGSGMLYLSKDSEGKWYAADWPGIHKIPVLSRRTSWHNMAGKDGRTDVWFTIPNSGRWHGVNIGDNQVLRVKKLKKRTINHKEK